MATSPIPGPTWEDLGAASTVTQKGTSRYVNLGRKTGLIESTLRRFPTQELEVGRCYCR
jgi:hypothetical protein